MQDQAARKFASMLSALAQPTRLKIVAVVARGPAAGVPAGEVARSLQCPASTLSFHLKELSQAGLLAAEPQGRFIRYRVVPEALGSLAEFVAALPRPAGQDSPAAASRPRRKGPRKSVGNLPKADEGQLSIFDE